MRRTLLIIAALLCLGSAAFGEAPAMTEAKLVRCEYSVYGGMENESTILTLWQPESREPVVTLEEDSQRRDFAASPGALDDLDDLARRYAPEDWAGLPPREYQPLDAPTKCVVLTCADGAVYTVTDDADVPFGLFGEIRSFLDSYTLEGRRTFALSFDPCEGEASRQAALSDPAKVWVSRERDDGSGETLVFHGRVPGRVELTIEEDGDGPGEKQKVYILEVDQDRNVACVEETTR